MGKSKFVYPGQYTEKEAAMIAQLKAKHEAIRNRAPLDVAAMVNGKLDQPGVSPGSMRSHRKRPPMPRSCTTAAIGCTRMRNMPNPWATRPLRCSRWFRSLASWTLCPWISVTIW